jgi:tripartite-type tricarboxylate transporter receptor subunit TctC
MPTRRALLGAAVMNGTALAQPGGRLIRFVVPFAAGRHRHRGPLFAEDLSRALGAPVDNRPGMAGPLGADSVAKSAADGTEILDRTASVQMTNPFFYPSLLYNAGIDSTPVIHLAGLPNLLAENSRALIFSSSFGWDCAEAGPSGVA